LYFQSWPMERYGEFEIDVLKVFQWVLNLMANWTLFRITVITDNYYSLAFDDRAERMYAIQSFSAFTQRASIR
jgi:hypothetical protein